MARISLTQAINLNIIEMIGEEPNRKPIPKTLELKRGVNEVDATVLIHPYIQSHIKAGSCSIVPDPMDPEDIAKAAEEIAARARAQAEAAKALKAAKQQEIDDAMAEASKPAAKPTPDEQARADEEELHRMIKAEEAEKAAAEKPAV